MTREVTLIAGEPQEFYEVADFFRLLAASAPLKVEFYQQGREVSEAVNVSKGYAEKFDRGTFDRVRLLSATTQAVQFVTRLGNVVLYDAAPIGDTAIVSSVPLELTAANLLTLTRPLLPGASWADGSAPAENTPLTVFTPAANVNGAIIHCMEACDSAAATMLQVFIAKNSAPIGPFDGAVLAQTSVTARSDGAGVNFVQMRREVPTRIAAGLGLYFLSSVAGAVSQARSCRYTLL